MEAMDNINAVIEQFKAHLRRPTLKTFFGACEDIFTPIQKTYPLAKNRAQAEIWLQASFQLNKQELFSLSGRQFTDLGPRLFVFLETLFKVI